MNLGKPELLALLWLLPALLLFLAWALIRRRVALAQLGALAASRVSAGMEGYHRWRSALVFLFFLLGLTALLQPRWNYQWQEVKRQGLDIVIVLDVSRSMYATDVSPSRMERAQREILDLADLLAGDRVGLVLFAGGAYPRMPLTLDYGALRFMVKDSRPETLSTQGSDIGAAIEAAVKLLGDRSAADQAILLVSDGEDNEGGGLLAAEKAAEKGIHLYALGIGTAEGAPIPLPEGGFKKDGDGKVVLSRLDEGALAAIARAGQGAYVRAGPSNADIAGIYEGEIRGKLQQAEMGSRRDKVWDEEFQWFLLAAFVAALGSCLLRPGALRLPGTVAGSAATLLLLSLGLARAADPDWSAKAQELATEQAAHPDDLVLGERLGEALYKAGDYDRARQVLEGVADRSLDSTQKQRARYNGGLAAYKGGQLTRAQEDWQRILQENPAHPTAKKNSDAVQKEIAARLNEQQEKKDSEQGQNQDQPQQDGQQQDGQQQDGQDQQQQDGQDQQQQAKDGEEQPGKPGERGELKDPGAAKDPPEEGAGAAQAESGQDTGESMTGEAAKGTAGEEGMSPAEAARLIDGVEEGSPRVSTGGRSQSGKDW